MLALRVSWEIMIGNLFTSYLPTQKFSMECCAFLCFFSDISALYYCILMKIEVHYSSQHYWNSIILFENQSRVFFPKFLIIMTLLIGCIIYSSPNCSKFSSLNSITVIFHIHTWARLSVEMLFIWVVVWIPPRPSAIWNCDYRFSFLNYEIIIIIYSCIFIFTPFLKI